MASDAVLVGSHASARRLGAPSRPIIRGGGEETIAVEGRSLVMFFFGGGRFTGPYTRRC